MQILLAQGDWAILVMRLALGLIFIAHGWRKASNFAGTVKWMGGEGFYPGWFWASVVTCAELLGGLFILVGLFTQPVALTLVINMMVAFAYNFKKNAGFFGHLELDLILIVSLLLLSTLGNGFFSLNGLLGIQF